MKKAQDLSKRFREVMLNGKWISNTNFKKQTESLNLQQATAQIGSLNTVALLCFHINYYIAGVLKVFKGGKLEIRDKFSFDLPTLNSEDDWLKLRQSLFDNSEAFAKHVEAMSDQQLARPFVDEKYGSYERNIEGMIEHAYYHMGQVVIINKLIREQSS